ncbi:laccase [Cyathus striatus]|nr:laccase [Cyathus striatus]
MFRTLVSFTLLAVAYGAIGPVADMHIVNGVIGPDGFNRSAVLAGAAADSASFPGPVVTGNKGDHFQLNVIDSLTDTTMLRGTSIHWHGIFQHNSSWADGPIGISQCPITSGDSFLYDFTVPDQAGTFWYHSHYSTQYCDGLRGALVVYDPDDPHKALYHTPAHAAAEAALVPTADSILINGKGRFAGGDASPLSVINVNQNTNTDSALFPSPVIPTLFSPLITTPWWTIIEVDGVNVEPLEVDSIQIFAGQRYSFVLNANQAVDNYWIRAKPNAANSTLFDGGLNSAILRYNGADDVDPVTVQLPNSNPMVETNLHPLENPGAPGGSDPADYPLNLAIAFGSNLKFSVNGATFAPPTVPVLLQIISGAQTAQDLLPAGSVYTLQPNQVVELSIPGGAPGSPHPFHLHGHTFDVIRSAGNNTLNYINPVRRDVVSTGTTGDNVTIRFRTDNAGPWILHCHIDWHLELGLAIAFAEDVPTIASSNPPTSWDNLCPTFDAQPPEFTS